MSNWEGNGKDDDDEERWNTNERIDYKVENKLSLNLAEETWNYV